MTTHDPVISQFAKPPPATEEERHYYSLNQKVYGAFAPLYDLAALPLRRVRPMVVAVAGVTATSQVLDVATGTGSQARAFADKAGTVIGIDLHEQMLRIARRKNDAPNLTFQQADATRLPFGNGRFDVACVSFALHEMPFSIRKRAVMEMVRVTKPGGTIVVVDYGRPPGLLGDVLYHLVKLYERDHYVDFIHSDLYALLKGTGIKVQSECAALVGAVRIVVGSRSSEESKAEQRQPERQEPD